MQTKRVQACKIWQSHSNYSNNFIKRFYFQMLLVFMFGKICQQFLWFLFLVAVDMCKTYVGCDLKWNKKPNKWWTMFKLMGKNCNTIFDQSCAFNSYRLVITKISTTCVPETMIVWNLRLRFWSYDVCWLDFVFFFSTWKFIDRYMTIQFPFTW